MSHFSKNTKVFVTDTAAFVKACANLGIKGKVTEGEHTITDFYGGKSKVALSVKVGNRYDIGLEAAGDGRYQMVGDWMMMKRDLPASMRGYSDEQLQNEILKNTTKEAIVSRYESEGFDCNVVEQKTGAIEITLTRGGSRY